MTTIIPERFEAYLKCPRKSYLISMGAVGVESRFLEWQRQLQEQYKEAASAHLRNSIQTKDWCTGTVRSRPFPERPYRVIFDYAVTEPDVHARLHAVELYREGARMGRLSKISKCLSGGKGIIFPLQLMGNVIPQPDHEGKTVGGTG
jgi:hypothetical protein